MNAQNLTIDEIRKLIIEQNETLQEYDIRTEFKTINDLQTYIILKERQLEAQDTFNEIINEENITIATNRLGQAIERIYTLEIWSLFYSTGKDEIKINQQQLMNSCFIKIQEAQERQKYLELYLKQKTGVEIEIEKAKEFQEQGHYEICLFKASKAKAQADILLSVLGMDKEQLNNTLKVKQKAAHRAIARSEYFPILGYSYYRYSQSLSEDDITFALLYAEYSIEMSNLDLYFEKEDKNSIDLEILREPLIFIIGVIIGVLIILPFTFRKKKVKKKKK